MRRARLRGTARAANVPQVLMHQGRLHDASGEPIQDSLPVTFSIYADPADATPLWTETGTITFDDGYFSFGLGETTPFKADLFDGVEMASCLWT